MTSTRQTATYLQRRFEEVGIRPDTKHGQNFLVDLNLLDVLVREADLQPDDVILEVGTGTGALTGQLASRAAEVVTVEIDPQLFQLARQELSQRDNVTMLRQDVLRNKNNLDAVVLETVRQRLEAHPGSRLKLAANLPYNIATPVISNLLTAPVVPVLMTVTIQKELAERITARPSTKDYSALSIWVQSLCDVEVVRVLPPTVFWPKPKVHSAILRIEPIPDKRARIADLDFYHQFVRSLFFHRRKFLRSVLLSAFKERLDKPRVDDVMASMGFGADSRAEQLDVEQVLTLSDRIRDKLAN